LQRFGDGEGKRDIIDIKRSGEKESLWKYTYVLESIILGVRRVVFGDLPYGLMGPHEGG
jgi:hypothetical protein